MKITVLILLSALLTSCYTLQEVKQPQYKTTHNLNIGYQEAYRLINTSLQDCILMPQMLHAIIYTDVGYASINYSKGSEVLWAMDLKHTGESKTTMEFYSPSPELQLYSQRIEENINNKISGCLISPLKQ